MKTHKGTAKRVKISASGKFIRERAFKNHLLAKKSASRKRNSASGQTVSSADHKSVKKALRT